MIDLDIFLNCLPGLARGRLTGGEVQGTRIPSRNFPQSRFDLLQYRSISNLERYANPLAISDNVTADDANDL